MDQMNAHERMMKTAREWLADKSPEDIAANAGVAFDRVKGFVADDMFDFTGIVLSNSGINTQSNQELLQKCMALVHPLGDGQTGLCQLNVAVFIHFDIAAILQKADGAADAGFGIAHMLYDVNRAYRGIGLGKDVDRLQVHFTGFLQMHCLHLLNNF